MGAAALTGAEGKAAADALRTLDDQWRCRQELGELRERPPTAYQRHTSAIVLFLRVVDP